VAEDRGPFPFFVTQRREMKTIAPSSSSVAMTDAASGLDAAPRSGASFNRPAPHSRFVGWVVTRRRPNAALGESDFGKVEHLGIRAAGVTPR
jgi:hypothetical protein